MSQVLVPLKELDWAKLGGLGMDEWVWIDLVGSGVHREPEPPAGPTAGLTHIWGWSRERMVRVRVDRALPHELIGSMLAPNGEGLEAVVAEFPALAWPATEGRVGLTAADRELLGAGTVVEARYFVGNCSQAIQFLRFDPRQSG